MSGEEKKKEAPEQPAAIEETFEQIESLISEMENQEIPLEEAFRLYQEGLEMLKRCSLMLDTVEKKMQVINSNGELEDLV